jgi:hypothetical protein
MKAEPTPLSFAALVLGNDDDGGKSGSKLHALHTLARGPLLPNRAKPYGVLGLPALLQNLPLHSRAAARDQSLHLFERSHGGVAGSGHG